MISTKERIKIFYRLAETLRNGVPSSVVERAIADNEWFSEDDINYALKAIADDLLGDLLSLNIKSEILKQLNIAIIMAGNIPAVGFADLLYVLIAGHRAYIKPSHKDRVVIEYIVGLLPELPIYKYDDTRSYDGVIATGGEGANLYFRTKFRDIPSILRYSRSSVAVLTGGETETQLRGLSDDIFRYSGMGCRSASLIFLPKATDLNSFAAKIAPTSVHPKYAKNYRYTRALLLAQNVNFTDGSNFVMLEGSSFPVSLSQINYILYDNLDQVDNWLEQHRGELQCIVGREVSMGNAQHPKLTDYADGIDVLEWLNYNAKLKM